MMVLQSLVNHGRYLPDELGKDFRGHERFYSSLQTSQEKDFVDLCFAVRAQTSLLCNKTVLSKILEQLLESLFHQLSK